MPSDQNGRGNTSGCFLHTTGMRTTAVPLYPEPCPLHPYISIGEAKNSCPIIQPNRSISYLLFMPMIHPKQSPLTGGGFCASVGPPANVSRTTVRKHVRNPCEDRDLASEDRSCFFPSVWETFREGVWGGVRGEEGGDGYMMWACRLWLASQRTKNKKVLGGCTKPGLRDPHWPNFPG